MLHQLLHEIGYRGKQLQWVIAVGICGLQAKAQTNRTTLNDCFVIAQKNNVLISQAKTSLLARQYSMQAEKQSYLPKVDLLASYSYLSKPLEINLQTVRDGIITGSSLQAVNTANQVYKEITGQNISSDAAQRIESTSRTIINAAYPNYNPPLSKQSYFLAGLGVRQPIYLGNKLRTVQDVATAEFHAGQINLELVQKDIKFAIALQYIRIMYINAILQKENNIVSSLQKNDNYANEMVKEQILPPYQRNWAKVALIQGKTRLNNQQLEKQNALVELNKLLGAPLDSVIIVTDTLVYKPTKIDTVNNEFYQTNPGYQFVNSKSALAEATLKGSKSFSLPNIFAVGNLNLYQNDLPVTIPPWFVGVEMQWTIFNGTQTIKRVKAAQQLLEESKLATENAKTILETQLKVAINKMQSLQNDVAALDSARQEANTTFSLIEERMRNNLSSPKDVNDALLIKEEIEKAYYTAVFGYYLAMAEYFNIVGTPEKISAYLQ
ncbi:TolC family protein [Chitinophagaceae bacterium 26-R-25]|nr:TolC family protein [Chitinophagaceae bacterium 26-R-25]